MYDSLGIEHDLAVSVSLAVVLFNVSYLRILAYEKCMYAVML